MAHASAGVVQEMRAVALAPQPAVSTTILPDWAAAAVIRPPRLPWPETQRWFAIELHDEVGTIGRYGPCSEAVVAIVRDQLTAAAIGWPVERWRGLGSQGLSGRHRAGPHFRIAISAVELAMWDLRSRRASRPVADLLGGARRCTVAAYATALGIDIDHPLAPDVGRWIAQNGFWGQKWGLPGADRGEDPRVDAERVRRLRQACGPEPHLMIDGLGRWNRAYVARLLPALAEADVAWVEEPTPRHHWPSLGNGLPLAAGEHAFDPHEQVEMITSGHIQIWQPDVAWHGGLSRSLAMVDLAADCGIPSFPHASSLPAALHLAALCDRAAIPAVEYHLTLDPRRHSVLEMPPTPTNGQLTLSSEPGLTSPYRLVNDDHLMLATGGTHAP